MMMDLAQVGGSWLCEVDLAAARCFSSKAVGDGKRR